MTLFLALLSASLSFAASTTIYCDNQGAAFEPVSISYKVNEAGKINSPITVQYIDQPSVLLPDGVPAPIGMDPIHGQVTTQSFTPMHLEMLFQGSTDTDQTAHVDASFKLDPGSRQVYFDSGRLTLTLSTIPPGGHTSFLLTRCSTEVLP